MSSKAYKASNLKFDFSQAVEASDYTKIVSKVLAEPLYPYKEFIDKVKTLVPKIPHSTFREELKKTKGRFEDIEDFDDFDIIVCDDIGNNDLDVLFQNPTCYLNQLLEIAPTVFSTVDFETIMDTYPYPADKFINMLEEKQRASVAAVCTLIRSNNRNNTFLPWLAHNMIPFDWCAPYEPEEIAKLGVFEKHKMGIASHEQYWAILSRHKEFQLIKANGDLDSKFTIEKVEKSRSGNSLRVWKGPDQLGARLVIIFDELLDNWVNDDIPLACFFPYSTNLPFIPDVVVRTFYELIMSPDTIVLRSMIHHEVFPVDSMGMKLIQNLFTIFASRGKIHRLISSIIAVEYSQPGDRDETMVLRSNSHLTCLFKFYASKFGQDYFYKVIKPIINEVSKRGDINIVPPKDESEFADAEKRVKELLYFSIDKLLQSSEFIPPQFRHIASILKACTALTLRSRHAVFNSLSSFMFLRFFTPGIVTPQNIVPTETYPENYKVTTVPFSKLIQLPFNFQPILVEKYPHLKHLSIDIFNRYSEIYNFTMDIAKYDQPAKYETTTEEEALEATKFLIKSIAKEQSQRNAFIRRVKDLSEKEDEKSSISFMFGNLFAQCFKN